MLLLPVASISNLIWVMESYNKSVELLPLFVDDREVFTAKVKANIVDF